MKKMDKVCHLTSVHPIDDVRIFVKECTSIAANGYDVTLIACGETAFEDIESGVKRISLNIPVKNRLQRIIKRPKEIYKKALQVNADIYHFHDPELLPIGLKLRKRGKKVIFDSHEFYGEQIREKQYIPGILRNVVANIFMKYEAYVCKRIDAVVQVCTLNGKDYFENRAIRSIFITNFPVLDKSHSKQKMIPFEKKKTVAYIGSLSYNRGITHLIAAAAKAEVKLILAGVFTPKNYQKELMLLPEYSFVDYRGFINKNEIPGVLNECFAGISTLLSIGQYPKIDILPTKVYEYMLLGIPVIISDTTYAKKMIDKYKFGVCVNPSNIDEIANAIQYLYDNPYIAKELGNNGRKIALKFFNWSIEKQKLVRLYENL